jgi:hypothetical protein
MFINDTSLVALEYVFYNKQGKYTKIKRDVHGVGKDGKKVKVNHSHHLGTDQYMEDIKKTPLSAFKQEPEIFLETKHNYLQDHLKTDKDGNIIKAAKQNRRNSKIGPISNMTQLGDTLGKGMASLENREEKGYNKV